MDVVYFYISLVAGLRGGAKGTDPSNFVSATYHARNKQVILNTNDIEKNVDTSNPEDKGRSFLCHPLYFFSDPVFVEQC